jgi:hypothetical protein
MIASVAEAGNTIGTANSLAPSAGPFGYKYLIHSFF